jgi:hypothetical protein
MGDDVACDQGEGVTFPVEAGSLFDLMRKEGGVVASYSCSVDVLDHRGPVHLVASCQLVDPRASLVVGDQPLSLLGAQTVLNLSPTV